MSVDRWVNVVVELTFVSDLAPSASGREKQEEAGRMLERLSEGLPDDLPQHVGTARCEVVSDSGSCGLSCGVQTKGELP